MFHLEKTHDPRKNKQLLAQINEGQFDLNEAVKETEQLFIQLNENRLPNLKVYPPSTSIPFTQKTIEWLWRLFSKPTRILDHTQISVDSEGNIYPDWKEKLDQEFSRLNRNITREVNVVDFGAVGDGKTDCTIAFKKAIGNGQVKVIVPEGIYITKGIQLPSWTILVGAGKGVTTIKLNDVAVVGTRLITNANHWRGNHHIFVGALSLDWNVERLGNVAKTCTWGNHSSCLTYAKVKYGWVRDVEAINPGLHCFDITSTLYNYAGDGHRARGGSQYVWLDGLTGFGFGDDGITTHHSDDILITFSHMCDPSGRAHQKGFSNSNGFEIDDGSRNVVLVGNSSTRCFGGVEIKAHQNSSAASNVHIVGHLSINDNRSYNFRHIGHHKSTDVESKTAYNIVATNLVSVAPVWSDLYKDSTPRGLVVSAYKNVAINHFTLIGDPDYDYQGNPVCAIQYRARDVLLKNFTFSGFQSAGQPIKVFGGKNGAEAVRMMKIKVEADKKAVVVD
ncbi:glycosyl hydrolase family 28-related protein [Neobacillus sp. LXY-4]|uniref:glycosyl hydrolase family 28-related protein n=1 Tax=Neobacillus sp. LXY-4 TaxID=3379826 RepID=UPI003EE20C19